MPHIISQGLPPTLESSCFANWHFLMQITYSQLFNGTLADNQGRIQTFNPDNLAQREVADEQLNAATLRLIHLVVTPKDRAHIRACKTTKEAWVKLDDLFLHNERMQSSKFHEANIITDWFVMNDVDSGEDMYRRLTALTMQMRYLEATRADDKWVKRKFDNALLPMKKQD
jgi:hypothetical protein